MKDAVAAALVLAVIAVPPITAIVALDGTSAIVVSWLGIGLAALILIGMFSSVLFKGLGVERTVSQVLIVAATGIAALIVEFGLLFRWIGLQSSDGKTSESLFDALYFSVVTWTTLGYGDFLPAPEARIIVIVEVLLGYLMMALLIAVFVSLMTRGLPSRTSGPG
ncbi:MAG: potassium channel family protein [Alphaproteobacteria bacterium]|nr:potassium channel family protein [Alphaproteobacteria bacterium]